MPSIHAEMFSERSYQVRHQRSTSLIQPVQNIILIVGRLATSKNISRRTRRSTTSFVVSSNKLAVYSTRLRVVYKLSRASRLHVLTSSLSGLGLVSHSSVHLAIRVSRTTINICRNLTVFLDELFYKDHQAESYAAFDRRFHIFMNECTPGMFILSYLLDPST
jgi:hypothetical protein